jgi:hypothetical protein
MTSQTLRGRGPDGDGSPARDLRDRGIWRRLSAMRAALRACRIASALVTIHVLGLQPSAAHADGPQRAKKAPVVESLKDTRDTKNTKDNDQTQFAEQLRKARQLDREREAGRVQREQEKKDREARVVAQAHEAKEAKRDRLEREAASRAEVRAEDRARTARRARERAGR